MNCTTVYDESFITCIVAVILSLSSLVGHVSIGLYYWARTGTCPLNEKIKKNISRYSKDGHQGGSH